MIKGCLKYVFLFFAGTVLLAVFFGNKNTGSTEDDEATKIFKVKSEIANTSKYEAGKLNRLHKKLILINPENVELIKIKDDFFNNYESGLLVEFDESSGDLLKQSEINNALSEMNPTDQKYKDFFLDNKSEIYELREKARLVELEEEKTQREAKSKVEEEARQRRLGLTWRYSENEEAMGRGVVKNAILNSSNLLSFEFPYQGSQRGTLIFRNHPKHGNDVIIQIEKGQIQCSSYDGCKVAVKFGDRKPVNYSASSAADGSSTIIFIRNYKTFLSNVKKVDSVSIELSVYKEGNPVLKFNTKGLVF